MIELMGILNFTPDSFFAPSRVGEGDAASRIEAMLAEGAGILDLGAVSTRPGAPDVSEEEEWQRLLPALEYIASRSPRIRFSIDTTSSTIVKKAFEVAGRFIVNDISAGEDDPAMLGTVAGLGLPFIAMHKRGNPRTMDSLCDYPGGIMSELDRYFTEFGVRAEKAGITDWILDPGLGFAKTEAQNWEILEKLPLLLHFGKPVLIGADDKRFTHGDNARAHNLAIEGGASILRVHRIPAGGIPAGELD